MKRSAAHLIAAVAAIIIAGCSNSAGVSCPDVAIPGIRVMVIDSVTNVLAGRSSSIVAKSATYTDSLSSTQTAVSDGPYGLLYSRYATGTYTLTIRQSGYRDWSQSGIVVAKADVCSLQTVNVTAKLQKQG
jgi:hypothetical protein